MLKVTTESGSIYEIDNEGLKVRRVPGDEEIGLRRDGEWLDLTERAYPKVGFGMIMHINAIVEGVVMTQRHTTPVVAFKEI
jgi:hypothetical protein